MPEENNINREDPQSFVVRVWREGLGKWRGKISHVQSKDSRAFARLEESTRFMAEHLPGVETAGKSVRSEARSFSLSSWMPRKRSLRLAMVTVLVVAAIAVFFYDPTGDSAGSSMAGTAQGSGPGSALIFLLGAVAGGVAVGMWARLTRRRAERRE